ncbi:hypothetical protein HH1059_03620 [Halorhodospira halochloris]|uniref:Uncharacterized protein n=1 Tax=Halorhodospira halochloris TaxID=1052 RepID=A0A110B4M2_HALHR|nr:hypothetical protein [Halorhodospira halochloris]MBK1652710.1 hypothetical protein [Halorhodospira halochloris]MCG5548899.1 hypothetical protein [Halorhodospira halochloris]BAU57038.1 hypothetical protein HH1059_03620 [Halorhodospira halochloris]
MADASAQQFPTKIDAQALYRWERGRKNLASFESQAFDLDSPDFKAWVADSLYWISRFNAEVAGVLQTWAGDEARFMRFYSDLLASRSKKFFFRENPNTAMNSPMGAGERTVRLLGEEIARLAHPPRRETLVDRMLGRSSEESRKRRLRWLLGKYVLHLLPLYEVLFNDDPHYDPDRYRKALFLRQELNYEKYQCARRHLDEIREACRSEQRFRLAVRGLPLKLLLCWQGQEPGEVKGKGLRRAYAQVMDSYRQRFQTLEPMSWHAAMVLWKIEGLMQDAWPDNPNKGQVLDEVSAWLERYDAMVERMYQSNSLPYGEWFDLQCGLVKRLFSWSPEDGAALYPWVDAYTTRRLLDEVDALAPQGYAPEATMEFQGT